MKLLTCLTIGASASLLITTVAMANRLPSNPSPVGLRVDQLTVLQVNAKYPLKYITKDPLRGDVYQIKNIRPLGMKKLSSVTLVFNPQKVLYVVDMKFNNPSFKSIYKALQQKYALVFHDTPESGDQKATFIQAQTSIYLYSPNRSPYTTLMYIDTRQSHQIMQLEKEKEQSRKHTMAGQL